MLTRSLFFTVVQKMSMSKHLKGIIHLRAGSLPNSKSFSTTQQNNSDNFNESKLKSSENNLFETFSSDKCNEYVEMRIPVPWGHIAAKAWGSSNGNPLLGVHGWMDNSGTFDTLAPYIPKSFYFVAVDLPGHGFSSHLPPGMPYYYTDFITSLRRIVTHFKWTKFSCIGHSLGAGLGSVYASIYSTEVERLILLDLLKPVTSEINSDAKTMGSYIDQYLSLEEKITANPPSYSYEDAVNRWVKAVAAQTGEHLSEKSAKFLMTRGCRRISEEKWIHTRDLCLQRSRVVYFHEEHCFDILNEIRCHVMAIKALEAPWYETKEVCDRALELYKAKCKSFQYVEVPGHHYVHLNEPENLADHISSFLLEQKSGL